MKQVAPPDVTALALARFGAVPFPRRKELIDRYGSPEALARLGRDPSGAEPEDRDLLKNLSAYARREEFPAVLQSLERVGGWVKAYGTPAYPRWLAETPDPPIVLFGLGELPPDDAVCLGFVGSRRPSPYGIRVGRMLARDLAEEGIVLVSGLARGIDAIAHEAALGAGTPTVAALGCGIDRVYPPEHSLLKERVAQGGAVVTEFFPGEPARPAHFPGRNRIISGLSRGVLVVEAGERSGARVTSRHALDQSREVFAVPGPIDAPLSTWTNRLIADGARLVASSADVLDVLAPGRSGALEGKRKLRAPGPDLSEGARRTLACFEGDGALSVEELVKKEGAPVPAILQALLELELKGAVLKRSDARYIRVTA